MNKQQVKLICEADGQMQWWAMVLFAEISEMMEYAEENGGERETETYYNLVQNKVKEFPALIIQQTEQKAKQQIEVEQSLQDRVKILEEKVEILTREGKGNHE